MFGSFERKQKNSDLCDNNYCADYTPSALACTFDDDLAFQVGAAAAENCKEQNNYIVSAPDVNIKRSALDGRGFEKLSEDPLISGRMGASFINGTHSVDGRACVKNYALRNQETGNMTLNVEVDERALRDVYLAPFEYLFKHSSPDAVMFSNNSVTGERSSDSASQMQSILRNEFGFNGLTAYEADSVKEILHKNNVEINAEIARRIALRSAVLLKNAESILPLKCGTDIAVIGDASICGGFIGALEDNNDLSFTYERGYDLFNSEHCYDLLEPAVDAAKNANAVVIFVGEPPRRDFLCTDKLDFSLPYCQNRLIEEICCVNRNTIVVVENDSLVEMPWENMVAAVLYQPCSSDIGASAVYDIVVGKESPAGRLAESWPVQIEDSPAYNNFAADRFTELYKESIFVGYKYYCATGIRPLFPFGHGLSYCSFEYSLPRLTKNKISFSVTNTSAEDGDEVVQIYVRPPKSSEIIREPIRLCDYKRVFIPAGTTQRLSFDITSDWFCFYNTASKSRECEGGKFTVLVGASCEDIRLEKTVILEPTATDFPSYKASAPAYLMPKEFRRPFNVSDNEFEALLGKSITRHYSSGEVTVDTPVLDLPENFLSKLFTKVILIFSLRKISFDDCGRSDAEFALLSMPIRCFLKCGSSALLRTIIKALCFILGGNIFARLKARFLKYMFEELPETDN